MTSIVFLLILWMTSCNLAAVSSAVLSVHTVRSLSRFYASAWSVLYAPVLSLVVPVPFSSVSVSRRSLNALSMICCWVVLDVTGGKNDGFEMHRAVVLVLLRWLHRGWCCMYAHFTAALCCFSGSSSVCRLEGSVSRLRFCPKRRPCGVGYCAAVFLVSMYSPSVQVAHEYDADCSLGREIYQLVTYMSRWPRVCQCPSVWRALFVFRASYLSVNFWCLLSFCSSSSLVWTCVGWVPAWCSAWCLYWCRVLFPWWLVPVTRNIDVCRLQLGSSLRTILMSWCVLVYRVSYSHLLIVSPSFPSSF